MLSSGQTRLLELGNESLLWGDLGKHLVMLGELVEQKLNGKSAPQGVPVDHGKVALSKAKPQSGRPMTAPKPSQPNSRAYRSENYEPQRLSSANNFGPACVLNGVRTSNFEQKPVGIVSSDTGLSGLDATFGVDSPEIIEPERFGRWQTRVAFDEVPPLPLFGPPGLVVRDEDLEAAPRTPGTSASDVVGVSAEDARPPVKVSTSPKRTQHSICDQHMWTKTRRSDTSLINQLIEELQVTSTASEYCPNGDKVTGLRAKVQRVLVHGHFEAALATAVMANAWLLGVQVDEAMRNSGQTQSYRILDTAFAIIFFIELCLRVYAERCWFFGRTNPNVSWNGFDSTVILISVLEEFFKAVDASMGTFASVSVLRLIRVLRIVRVLRTVRLLRYFRDLRIMILGIFGSMKSLTWAIALLLLLMYLTAVLIVDTLTDYREDSKVAQQFFGSVLVAMYTLFLSILGGLDWGDAAQPLYDLNVVLGLAYSLYVAFSILCVLNIVTGVFVENANRQTSKSEDEVLVERLQVRQRHLDQATTIIAKYHDSSTIQESDFERLLGKVEFQAALRKLDVQLEPSNARSLFNVIDFDGSGIMQVDELVSRIDQLHGTAKSIDIMRLMHVHSALHRQVELLIGRDATAYEE